MPDEALLKDIQEHAALVRANRENERVAREQSRRDYEDFVAAFETLKSQVILPALSSVAKEYSDNAAVEDGTDSHAVQLTLPGGRWIGFGIDTTSRRVVTRCQLQPPSMALRIGQMQRPTEVARLTLEETTSLRVDQLISKFLRDYLSAVRQEEPAK